MVLVTAALRCVAATVSLMTAAGVAAGVITMAVVERGVWIHRNVIWWCDGSGGGGGGAAFVAHCCGKDVLSRVMLWVYVWSLEVVVSVDYLVGSKS